MRFASNLLIQGARISSPMSMAPRAFMSLVVPVMVSGYEGGVGPEGVGLEGVELEAAVFSSGLTSSAGEFFFFLFLFFFRAIFEDVGVIEGGGVVCVREEGCEGGGDAGERGR